MNKSLRIVSKELASLIIEEIITGVEKISNFKFERFGKYQGLYGGISIFSNNSGNKTTNYSILSIRKLGHNVFYYYDISHIKRINLGVII